MPATAVLLVVLSGLVHATWNLLGKQSRTPLGFFWWMQAVGIALYGVPGALVLAAHGMGRGALPWLLLSVLSHGVYVLLLASAYKRGDLSQVYPLMRGTGPLLVPALATALLGEGLLPLGWLGVALVVAGILLVSGSVSGRLGRPSRPALLLALGVGLSITCYTLVDKVALQYIPALSLNALASAGNLAVLTLPAWRGGEIRRQIRGDLRSAVLGGVLSPGSYLLFLLALSMAPVAAIAPMREVGIAFAALLGVLVLHERDGRRRIAGAALIVLGAMGIGRGA